MESIVSSPLASLGAIIRWLVVGLAIVLGTLAVLRLLEASEKSLSQWITTRRRRRRGVDGLGS